MFVLRSNVQTFNSKSEKLYYFHLLHYFLSKLNMDESNYQISEECLMQFFLVLYSRSDVTLLPNHSGERHSVPREEGCPQVRGRESSELQGGKMKLESKPLQLHRENVSVS
jgi:hypothetical protein